MVIWYVSFLKLELFFFSCDNIWNHYFSFTKKRKVILALSLSGIVDAELKHMKLYLLTMLYEILICVAKQNYQNNIVYLTVTA